MLTVKNLTKIYKSKNVETRALDDVSIEFPEKGFVFLLGKSGSGKSTLLNCIGGLDSFDGGEIIIKGKSSKDFSQSDFDSYRNTYIGFIFQEYNILENFTVAKNLALAIELQGKKPKKEDVEQLLEQVEMLPYAKRKPNQLSGGQKQRVAIARALIKNPEIIMADEPTGALDSNTGRQVMETLKELSKTKLVIVVSHDREFAELYGDRIIELKDGKIINDVSKHEILAEQTSSGIKVIDNNVIYIKKGQQISTDELMSLAKVINDNSKNNDTFISFDAKANAKLKEGAKINDEGNKEKFIATTREDYDLKQYNPKDLKLIRSHLKFGDSFKMGASSLKSKIGKLVFTIIISIIAFTLFGIIDALASWNRAASVYQTIKATGTTNIAFKKKIKSESGSYYYDSVSYESDLNALSQKFPTYAFKGVVGAGSYSSELRIENQSPTVNLRYFIPGISGFVSLDEADKNAFGFDLVDGRLPVGSAINSTDPIEVCISTFNLFCLKKAYNNENLDWKNQMFETFLGGYRYRLKIVGIIDDHVDLSSYTSKSETELENETGSSWKLINLFDSGFAKIAYVSNGVYNNIVSLVANNVSYSFRFEKRAGNSSSSTSTSAYKNSMKLISSLYNTNYSLGDEEYDVHYKNFISAVTIFAGGVDKFTDGTNIVYNFNEDEIIMQKSFFEFAFNDEELQAQINSGLYIDFTTNYGSAEKKFKVVGVYNSSDSEIYGVFANQQTINNYQKLFYGYLTVLTHLNGSADQALINYIETPQGAIKFSVQNDATSTLDMFGDIIETFVNYIIYVAIGLAVFASLILMNYISNSITYKKREIGVLRALGARGSDVFGIFFNEATIIALINFGISSLATIIICLIINSSIAKGLNMQITLFLPGIRQVLLILAISWGSAFLASLIPTTRISKKKPIDAINNR